MARTTTSEGSYAAERPRGPANRFYALDIVDRIIWFVIGVILILLFFRFLLALFGANPANGFADFIYSTSHPLVAPFFGLFNYNFRYGISSFEIYTLVAMLVYLVVGWLVSLLINIGRG